MKLPAKLIFSALIIICLFVCNVVKAEPGVSCSSDLESSTPLLNTALHNIYSFSYIREALADLSKTYPNAEFCVSGLAVSRNIYQYPEYFIQVAVRSGSSTVHQMYLLFQDASVQALDNVGDKPWIGLPLQTTTTDLSQFIQKQTLQTLPLTPSSFDVEAVAKNTATYKNSVDTVDSSTFSIFPIKIASDRRDFYILSWLTLQGNNPFSSYVYLKAVLLAHDSVTGEVSVAENLWLNQDLLAPLEQSMSATDPVPDEQRVSRLLEGQNPQP